jgi:hypothetical protein
MESVTTSIPVDNELLDRLLPRLLGAQVAAACAWQSHKLGGGLELDSAILRLEGSAECDGQTRPWSLIVKTVRPGAKSADAQGFNYWKREALAYQSGFLEDLPGKLTAPRCYAVSEDPGGSLSVFIEDLKDELPQPWTIEQYARVARILGEFNGAYLAGRPLPAGDWVSRDWLRAYLENAAPMAEFIHQNPAHPVIQGLLPGITLPMTLAVWDEYHGLLGRLDSMPQTFCHQDAFGRNLFNCGERVVAIDWGYAGIAPLGAELAPLVGAAHLTKFPGRQLADLDRACFSAYLEGLRQAGHKPDPRQVRQAYTLTMSMRYVFGATVGQVLPMLLDERTRQHLAEGFDVPVEKVGESDPDIVAYYTSIFIEAIRSLGLVSMIRFLLRTLGYIIRLGGKRRGQAVRP